MVQNLKIDIIYYNTPSDFEFEFNLGGCCHSRVLNSRTHHPKEMLSSLAKAVSRSRVIIIIGETNGEDGLIPLISKAVGVPLCDADATEYRIKNPNEPKILENSLPLVSKDGILCGCIVESGPQSIILLSENKSLRKDICDNLVFPYVTAISRTPETEEVINNSEVSNEPEELVDMSEEQEETPLTEETLPEEIIDDNEPEADISSENEESVEIADETAEDDEVIDAEILFPESDEKDNTDDDSDIIFSGAKLNFEESEEDSISLNDNFIIDDKGHSYNEVNIEDAPKTKKAKKPMSKLTLAILILCGFLLITAGLILYLLVYEPTVNSTPVAEYLNEFFNFL